MEVNSDLLENSETNSLDVFKLDYEGQNYINNIEFKKFEISMKNKYGNKARLFKCKEDKILFYDNNSNFPFYESKCPKCKKSICYFCSSINNFNQENCCLSKKIYYMFKVDGFLFLDKYPKQLSENINFNESLIYCVVPFVNLLYFIGCLHAIFFYKLKCKNQDPNYYYLDYGLRLSNEGKVCFFRIIVLLDAFCSLFLSIPLLILNIYITIIIIIISIPFKFYPMKYLFGIHHSVYYVVY